MTIDFQSLWMFSFVFYPDDVAAAVAVAAQSAVVPLETSSHLQEEQHCTCHTVGRKIGRKKPTKIGSTKSDGPFRSQNHICVSQN